MASPKPLMEVSVHILRDLAAGSETGMGFYIGCTASGLIVVFENGDAMPLYPDPTFYCEDDLLGGDPIPKTRQQPTGLGVSAAFASRAQAVLTLLTISPKYVGTAGAIPRIATEALPVATTFLRYISSPKDHRYNTVTGELRNDTYLTSKLDKNHADTGFGSVGRYALPLPIPVTSVIEYTLSAGTVIEVGTVEPAFGQAGGGVEIRLPVKTRVTVGKTTALPPY